jgi:long-chain acyl-CoA synthetase
MLDDQVSQCAAALHERLGRTGAIVAVAAVLDPMFAVAYYAIARSGNISAVVNPLLQAGGLEHVLRASGAEAAIVTPGMLQHIRSVAAQLPRLRHVVVMGPPPGPADGVLVLSELMAAGAARKPPASTPAAESTGCIVFTSGTTGAPKAVRLTHRNVTVNAAQMVRSQGLSESSVMLNYFPTFHTMHLNGAVYAAATQVLHQGDDVAASIEIANQHGVTHYYSLPVRLAQLAADERLPGLRLHSARGLLSGGSALPPAVAGALATHFGIPVVQGYGLAEAAPLTHFNQLATPRLGSCGQPVAGTECRVVEIETRRVLPSGQKGEIEVRGPQLMIGYIGHEPLAAVNDGWLSTGDIGYVDADGYLFLTDRLKDVFKRDNFIVSPSEIESVLRRHPAIADCAVVDYPDEHDGLVAYGLAVLRDPSADLTEIRQAVNAELPYYMHLSRVQPVDAIPRSRHGKVLRRELREQVRGR